MSASFTSAQLQTALASALKAGATVTVTEDDDDAYAVTLALADGSPAQAIFFDASQIAISAAAMAALIVPNLTAAVTK